MLPVVGDDTALFVSQFAGEHATYFQRADGAKKTLGPVVTLWDENVIAAFAAGDELRVTSAKDSSICLTTYRGAQVVARGCDVHGGAAFQPLGDRFVVLSTSTPDPDAKKKDATGKAAKSSPPPPAPAKKEPPKRTKSKPSKRKAKVEVKIAADPKKLSIDRLFVRSDGSIDGEIEPTGLEITSPLAGMDLVAAASSGSRVRALYYDWVGTVKNAKTGVLGKARLALGSIDDTGKYDEASRSELKETDLMFGYLAEHQEPRLLPTSRGTLYLGVASSRGKCEAIVVSPFSMPLIPDDAYCALDPRAFFGVAETVRAAQKAGASVGRAGFPTPLAPSAELAKARRVALQNDWDPVRTAVWGDRGYAMSGDSAVTFTSVDKPEPLPRPLVAERARMDWAAFAPDGSGIASVGSSLVFVDPRGAVTREPVDGPLSLRSDEAEMARRLAVKIGSAWFQSRGAVRRLGGTKRSVVKALPGDGAVLVGGPRTGLVLEIGSGRMQVSRFDPETLGLAPLVTTRAPVGVGLDAVERHAGGALVAGVDPSGAVVAFALGPNGEATTPVDTGLPRGARAVRLTALPDGGALLTDLARSNVVWLDDDARPVARAAWPAPTKPAKCIDGRPAPTEIPSPVPGKLVHVDDLAAEGTCMTGEISWAPDGSIAWFGSTASGPHTRPELGRVAISSSSAPPPKTPATFAALSPEPPSPCPTDMVSVRGRYCVDRFEGALAARSTGMLLSPDVATTASLSSVALAEWSTRRERVGDLFARALPLPHVNPLQLGHDNDVVAMNRMGLRPSGYVTGVVARAACEASGKRLCSLDEWRTACRGEADRLFPYGVDYEDGACNVNREAHPAGLLHGHSSIGHLDPRLNHARAAGSPLFHAAGESPRCVSRWGDDGIFDMVGNVDEWVDEGAGAFAGGFYARGTKSGCGALVDNHPASYLDYSTGIRCCRDASAGPASTAPSVPTPGSAPAPGG